MNIVILHHHLNPGGVTRVVENHLRALGTVPDNGELQVLLLHGGRCQDWPLERLQESLPFQISMNTIEGLDYDLTGTKPSEALGQRIARKLASEQFTPENTLLHWHNHSLGKNASTPLAVTHLATQGYRQLLQVHDFAEDFRPSNYRYLLRKLGEGDAEQLAARMYPQSTGIHYAVLNGRDRAVLAEAGIERSRLHFLPNPVAGPPLDDDADEARRMVNEKLAISAEKRFVVYPVRGIRRKNLGEFLLWSTACRDAHFLVTLAPQNPAERASFDRWSALAEELELPCTLGVPSTAELAFGEILAASDALLTTSVAEGFGMTFLECWLVERDLLGRDLPEITQDFTCAGLDLSQLYETLEIPTQWFDRGEYLSSMSLLMAEAYSGFGVVPTTPEELREQLASLIDHPTIDFARLPSSLQASVIRQVHQDESRREQLLELNPKLAVSACKDSDRVTSNAAITQQQYSLANLGEQLLTTYQATMASTTADATALPRGQAILGAFLRTDRFNPVRVES
ncbi:glycosyltransferase family protein [Adhaeretor mobilis]|uniref:Glycosyltransferase n=1 Tax=Adhaeretor mobilis TaxID=1930276 RepID=A0A517MSY7_9BACT|nr:glycosyltransferase family 4 protein [Adhaeretor mobilis]QDS98006.1 hypothetical protein HG15A2_12760 [Adhaeretor mobilis]